jgi:hypothetical protein
LKVGFDMRILSVMSFLAVGFLLFVNAEGADPPEVHGDYVGVLHSIQDGEYASACERLVSLDPGLLLRYLEEGYDLLEDDLETTLQEVGSLARPEECKAGDIYKHLASNSRGKEKRVFA